ncbi:uncharacterized protein [Dysidea avara]|uniref:uncharacterized protein n=1 Tax=Dysidea avara TaxID=196820 RepID=UPI003333F8FD
MANYFLNEFLKWLHRGAAERGWEEIYSHLQDYVQQPIADETDTASAVTATAAKSPALVPCKCNRECDEGDEESYTIIRYKDLTITIYGKVSIGDDLISLSKYEHLCLLDEEERIVRPRTMQQPDRHIINQFGLPPTSNPVPFRPLDFSRPRKDRILMIAGRRGSQQVRIFNGMTGSYLMIEKDSSTSYSVFVAPRNRRISALSTFIVNLRNHPTVLYLHDNPDYALKFDADKQRVIVEQYMETDQRFRFELDRVGNPNCRCDCNSSI